MRPMLGKRAERKSLFFVTVIFVLAVIGAVMSSGGYKLGQEAITGHVVSPAAPVNVGFFGLLLACLALVVLFSVGYYVFTGPPKPKKATAFPELASVDKEIESLSQRLNDIDNSFGKY
ncbi:hypothetical protein ACFL96_04285 [Thermoproteota archaeon]